MEYRGLSRFLRNRVNEAIKNHKATKIKRNLDRPKSNPKKFWDSIRDILPGVKDNTLNELVDAETGTVIEKQYLPGYINEFFVKIGEQMVEKWSNDGQQLVAVPATNEPRNDRAFKDLDNDITPAEVRNVVYAIDINKSSGIENIRTNVYKDEFQILLPQLIKIFNASLQFKIFPESWKKGTVVTLPKKDNVTQVTDLRPISLLPLPGKLLERLLCDRLIRFLEMNNILVPAQHGFRKGRSTISAITALLNDVYGNRNNTSPF